MISTNIDQIWYKKKETAPYFTLTSELQGIYREYIVEIRSYLCVGTKLLWNDIGVQYDRNNTWMSQLSEAIVAWFIQSSHHQI